MKPAIMVFIALFFAACERPQEAVEQNQDPPMKSVPRRTADGGWTTEPLSPAKRAERITTTTPAATPPQNFKRLFLENHAGDDPARNQIFRNFIRKKGRCDSIESALKSQTEPIWRITCSPGYTYTFIFGPDGMPTGMLSE